MRIRHRAAGKGGRLQAVEYGWWETSPRDAPALRLKRIHDEVAELIARHEPEAVALEESFVGADARIALSVGQARGAALVACATADVPCAEYPPATVKQAVCGYGRAEKDQVQRMVKAVLGLPSSRGRTMQPTRSPSRSATRSRRRSSPSREAGGDRAPARHAGRPRRGRPRPRRRRRRLPAARDADARSGRRTAPTRSSSRPTCTSARTRSSSTASPTRPSASSSSSFSPSPASGRRWRSRSSPATRPAELSRAIVREDAALFQTIPGIGKKTAQRVVLELKERIAPLAAVDEAPHLGAGDGHIVARDALVELGYSRPRPSSASPRPTPTCRRPSGCARRFGRPERVRYMVVERFLKGPGPVYERAAAAGPDAAAGPCLRRQLGRRAARSLLPAHGNR